MNHPKHILATGSLIQNENHEILLVETERPGWEIPGGQVEEGEDIVSALKREIIEETGVNVNIKKLTAFYSSISKPSKVIFDFICEYTGGLVKPGNEVINARWFSIEKAMQNIKSEPMLYRIEWLLKKNDKIRYSSYSKDPFKVISENFLTTQTILDKDEDREQ